LTTKKEIKEKKKDNKKIDKNISSIISDDQGDQNPNKRVSGVGSELKENNQFLDIIGHNISSACKDTTVIMLKNMLKSRIDNPIPLLLMLNECRDMKEKKILKGLEDYFGIISCGPKTGIIHDKRLKLFMILNEKMIYIIKFIFFQIMMDRN
jgi:hypothetical protein